MATDPRAPFKRQLYVGTAEGYPVFVTIQWENERLSLVGVEGPLPSGRALGDCGQISLAATVPLKGFPLADLAAVWARWHLNDRRAGCEHQRAAWDTRRPLKLQGLGKTAGWVTPEEHPDGLLGRPCPTCGYKYGSAWLKERVPDEVLAFLRALPDEGQRPPRPWLDCAAP